MKPVVKRQAIEYKDRVILQISRATRRRNQQSGIGIPIEFNALHIT
jgi:hypothetical protein